MKKIILFVLFGILFLSVWIFIDNTYRTTSRYEHPSQDELRRMARCLTNEGWIMYGSITCSGCRAQRKAFGDAFSEIIEVECNAYAPNSQAKRCLKRKIGPTPTWIMEKDGKEVKRIEGYQLIEDLALVTGCHL